MLVAQCHQIQFNCWNCYIVKCCILTFGDRRSSSEPVVRDVATIEDAISESGTYSYAESE